MLDLRSDLAIIPQATPAVTLPILDGTPPAAMRITRVDTNNLLAS